MYEKSLQGCKSEKKCEMPVSQLDQSVMKRAEFKYDITKNFVDFFKLEVH